MTTHPVPPLPSTTPTLSPDHPDPTPLRPADPQARPTDVCRFPFGEPAGLGGRAVP
jgi:hypothetical protein